MIRLQQGIYFLLLTGGVLLNVLSGSAQCPDAEYNTNLNPCLGDTSFFDNLSTDTCGAQIVESKWYFNLDGGSDFEDTIIVSGTQDVSYIFDSAKVYPVRLIIVNKQDDTDLFEDFITVLSPPIANTSGDTTVCPGDSAQLSAEFDNPNFTDTTWTPAATLTDPNIADPIAFPDTTTNYVVEITRDNGCKDHDTVRIRVSDPGTDAGFDQTICTGDSTILGGYFADTSNFDYSWSPTVGLDDPSDPNPKASPPSNTDYVLAITDLVRGCTFRDTMRLTLGNTKAIIEPDTVDYCEGGKARLFAAGGTEFQWSPSQDLSCTQCRTTETTTNDSTVYTVSVSSGSCSDEAKAQINVNPIPVADAGVDTHLCIPDSIQIGGSPAVIGGTTPYSIQWTPDYNLSDNTAANPQASPTQNTQYTLNVTDDNGCSNTDSMFMTASPYPVVDAQPTDTTIFIGEYVQLQTPLVEGQYTWSPDYRMDSIHSHSPLVQPLENTEYIVRVDSQNCLSYDTVRMTVEEKFDVFVPDAFTPNGDGINDRAFVQGVGIAKVINFKILNRWGKVVYSATSKGKAMREGWDGQYNGAAQSSGNYAYILVVENFHQNRSKQTGTITLLR